MRSTASKGCSKSCATKGARSTPRISMNSNVLSLKCLLLELGILFFFLFVSFGVATSGKFGLDEGVLVQAEQRYGPESRQRLLAWVALIRDDTNSTDEEKLVKVNDFFNRYNFVSDAVHWQIEDYWATPVEFIASDGGDCEDFSLAKYFTLKAMGVQENKLNLTYVKALNLNQSHMVLTYFVKPGAEPLILDNLINAIQPATQRTDLLPVYSFNGSGLWIAKQRGRGELVGKSDRLSRWQDLLGRMPQGLN